MISVQNPCIGNEDLRPSRPSYGFSGENAIYDTGAKWAFLDK